MVQGNLSIIKILLFLGLIRLCVLFSDSRQALRQNLQLLTNKTIGRDEGDQSYVIFYAKLHSQNSCRPLLPPKVFFLSQNLCHLPFYFPAAKLIFLILLNTLVMANTFEIFFFLGVRRSPPLQLHIT